MRFVRSVHIGLVMFMLPVAAPHDVTVRAIRALSKKGGPMKQVIMSRPRL
jgi:hypothetical protein